MENYDLPPRMFAQGHEPVGIRVQAYHPSRGISRIISALEEDEVEYIRQSPFGKLLTLADKPSFSGRFVRFLLSRMLKVNKKHEVWFLFCARPVRFSLREFAIVTGLPCSEFPKKSKRKLSNMISEKSNWGALFGTLKSISVKMVVKMLRKKTVTDKTTRLKYACLALLDSVILPTTHKHKISKEHAEAIKDLDEFLAYPWGRVAFDMIISSITDRDEVSLSQPTLALKGFVHAIQLVLVEAVPLLNEVVQPKTHSDSESGEDSDETELKEAQPVKVTLSPSHARNVHDEEQAIVDSIISDTNEPPLDETMFTWADETVDPRVDTMVQLLGEEHEFCSSMFGGGLTLADVDRLRKEAKLKKVREKAAKNKVPSAHSTTAESSMCMDDVRIPAEDIQRIADTIAMRVTTQLTEKTRTLETKIEVMRQSLVEFKTELTHSVTDIKTEIVDFMNSKLGAIGASLVRDMNTAGQNISNVSAAGVTVTAQQARVPPKVIVPSGGDVPAAYVDQTSIPCTEARKVSSSTLQHNLGLQCHNASAPARGHTDVEPAITTPTFSLGLTQHLAEPSTNSGPHFSHAADATDVGVVPPITRPTFSLGLTQTLTEPSTETGTECQDGELVPDGVATQTPLLPLPVSHVLSHLDATDGSTLAGQILSELPSTFGSQTPPLKNGATLEYLWTSKDSDSLTLKFARFERKILPQFEFGVGNFAIKSRELRELYEFTTDMSANVMNVLVHHTCTLLSNNISPSFHVDFLDARFVTSLMRGYSKFTWLKYKEKHAFPKSILTRLGGDTDVPTFTDGFYIPLHVKKHSWKGLCVDFGLSTIYVLDPNCSEMDFAALKKEVQPFASMLPYALQQVISGESSISLEEFAIEPLPGIHQFERQSDSGMATVLLMQAHSVAGPEECRRLTPDLLQLQARKFLVTLYEEHRQALA